MSFQNAHDFTIPIRGNLTQVDNSNHYTVHSGAESSLKSLVEAACLQAGHEAVECVDRPKCHPETRLAVTEDIMTWVNSSNPENERILWLSGPAGAGKSSICQTTAQQLTGEGMLMSSFFFSRTAGNGRENGNKLIPTVAYYLALAKPKMKEFITAELERDPEMFNYAPMETQFKKLVIGPLSKVADLESVNRFIVIIDGLDECGENDTRDSDIQTRIIKMFASAPKVNNIHMRCLIASRPELEIRNAFSDPSIERVTTNLKLDSRYNPDKDIRTYLLSEFATIRQMQMYRTLYQSKTEQSEWPSEEDVNTLVVRSSGQFIYASTVIKFIKDKRSDPKERLNSITALTHGNSSPYAELDVVYTYILKQASENTNGYGNILPIFQALLHMYKEYWSTTESEPDTNALLPVPGSSKSGLTLRLVDLHSILYIPDFSNFSVEELKFYHASFSDFLSDKSRSKEFFVSETKAHVALGRFCLARFLERDHNDENKPHSTYPSGYKYSCMSFLLHMEASMPSSSELITDFLACGDSKKMINRMLIQMKDRFRVFLTASHFVYLIMKYYEKRSSTHDGDKDPNSGIATMSFPSQSLSESWKKICKLLEVELDEIVRNEISSSFECQLSTIFSAAVLHDPQLRFIYVRNTEVWAANVIESRERGGNCFLSSNRSREVFINLLKLAKEGELKKVFATVNDFSNITQLPNTLEYLLGRILPEATSTFDEHLSEIMNTEDWFRSMYEKNPPKDIAGPFAFYKPLNNDQIIRSIQSLRSAIDIYLKKCAALTPSKSRECDENDDDWTLLEL